jgi:ribosome-associated protein
LPYDIDAYTTGSILQVSPAAPQGSAIPERARKLLQRRRHLAESAELTQEIIDILSDRQAEDIVLLDISQVSNFADSFIVASARSLPQFSALVQALEENLGDSHARPPRVEGTPDSGWVLLDFGDVVVHLFSPAARSFYDLEGLWSRSVPVVRFQ